MTEPASLDRIVTEYEIALGRLPDWAESTVLLVVAAAIGLLAHGILFRVLRRLTDRRGLFLRSLVGRSRRPVRLGIMAFAIGVAASLAPLSPDWAAGIRHGIVVALIVLAGWTALIAVYIFTVVYSRQFSLDTKDNLSARKHLTQIRILRRAGDVFIVLVTAGAALMTFEGVRQYGVSLLASAGAAGIIVGFALQPILKNLVAGIQIAITQPIRIDDAVVVEGEWGWIEEISSTYVVVKIWDWRRLILPLSYFIEQPFQNWTRENADILGSVFLRTDYRVPLDDLRAHFEACLKASERWDGKAQVMQVTEAGERSLEIRFLMSAADSPTAWDLRCEIREKLIVWLQENHPDSLPRQRAEIAPLEGEPFRAAIEGQTRTAARQQAGA